MKRTSAIRVLGRYLDRLCGPVPRVMVAADRTDLREQRSSAGCQYALR